MNGVFQAEVGIRFQPFVVHPGVRAGAKRGRRICFVAFAVFVSFVVNKSR
jgi:hypothetical protein